VSGAVLVVLQHRDGSLHRMSREAIAAGQSLAAARGGRVAAVLLGDDLDAVAAEAARFDLAAVHVGRHQALAAYTPGAWAGALEQIVRALEPAVVLLPHTYQSVDFMGLLAQRLDAALVPEATGFRLGEGRIVWSRPILGGKLSSEVAVKGEGTVLASLQSGCFAADQAAAGAAEILPFAFETAPQPDREVLGVEQVAGEQVDLTQAAAIVAVGRGIGDADKMGVAEELAAVLGAELAASRPVIDNGWLPRDRQIGSSGQTVSPKLYIALGISGAIQHVVGMKGSKTVVAVNRDAGAPIFSIADYGYVGDLHEFVPALIRALRESAEG
jgi:electron transfer flavoprotein alpha subunit